VDEAEEAAEEEAEEEQHEEEQQPDAVAVQAPEAVPLHESLESRNPKRLNESEKRQRGKIWPRHPPTDTPFNPQHHRFLSASSVPRRESG
jgi:hypothetical protein